MTTQSDFLMVQSQVALIPVTLDSVSYLSSVSNVIINNGWTVTDYTANLVISLGNISGNI